MRLVLVMTRQNHRRSRFRSCLSNNLLDQSSAVLVDVCGRFIQKQHVRLEYQQPGQGHALPLAARKLAVRSIRETVQADAAQHVSRPADGRLSTHSPGPQAVHDIVEYRHPEERRVLQQDGAAAARFEGSTRFPYITSVEKDSAAIWSSEKGHQFQETRFAAAVGTDDRQKLSRSDFKLAHTHGLDLPRAARHPVSSYHVFESEPRRHSWPPPWKY